MVAQSIYRIDVVGELDERWSQWFVGIKLRQRKGYAPEAEVVTVITTPPLDSAGLHGLLAALFDHGIPLLAVERKRSM